MSEQVLVAGPVEEPTDAAGAPGPRARSAGPRSRRWLAPAALVAGLLAVLATVLLPVAPVTMSQPVVSWPQSPSAPASTMLQLTTQTPLSLDVRFTCAAARAAAGTADGVLLATVRPGQPQAGGEGLLVTAGTGGLAIEAAGTTVLRGAPLDGDCAYQVSGDAREGLVATRDGQVVGRGEAGRLPAVDVLATSVTALSPAAGEQLSAELAVDDQFSTSPTPVKWVLIVVVLLGAAGSMVFLVLEQRGTRSVRAVRGRRPGPLDVVVPLVMIGWLFLAPMSDDDGYYAAMARNSLEEGAVGNYYQLLNQNFTPFTWFYRLLGVWQQVGDSPAVLRVPALVTGLLTWFVLRRYTSQPGALPAVLQGRRGRGSLVLVLALAYLAWWLPYGMGVRPEAVVGFLALATLLAVSAGLRRRSLPLLGVAVVAAAMSAVCHPTGFVALAPLLAGAPRTVELLRDGVPVRRAWLRGLAVIAPGAVAGIAAFGDGSLNDFLRGQEVFLSIQAQNDWFDEYLRYEFLFSPIAMGSYAKRIAVVLGIMALVWFALVAASSRGRRTVGPPLLLAGQSLALGFLLLWITPSKWTHHFGALDGIGPAFLALFLVSLPVLVRGLPGGIRNGPVVGAVAVGTTALGLALSFHGPNQWAYSWLQGLPRPRQKPALLGIALDNVLLWVAVVAVVVLVVRRSHRRLGVPRRRPWLTALPIMVSTALAVSVLYLVGGFAVAAARTMDSYSPWADALSDPTGSTCGPAKAIDVPDLDAARPLTPAAPGPDAPGGLPAAGTFTAGTGFYPPSPPPTAPGTGPATQLWGSLRGSTDGSAVGRLTTPWFPLPAAPADGDRVAVLVSGDLTDSGSHLTAEYGSSRGGRVETVATTPLDDATDSAVWRTQLLDVPPGADAVRLVGVDGATDPTGWLAFTGPSVVPVVALSDLLPSGAPVATAWQYAFLFPCQRQLSVTDGITEPMQYAVMRAAPGTDGVGGVRDDTWQLQRGGLFAPTLRSSSVTLLGGRFRDFPAIDALQVFQVVAPHPVAAYDLVPGEDTRWGWQGPEESRWPYPAGLP